MANFATTYKQYIKEVSRKEQDFGFDLRKLAYIEPLIAFLYQDWWQVQTIGIDRLPEHEPALIVGNTNGLVPPALMLLYAMMANKDRPRRVNILADLDWIEDEDVLTKARALGFVPWSAENLKHLFAKGELVAIFPEGNQALLKPFSERYRLRDFDWTRFLPAVEQGMKIFPMATIGVDEAVPTIASLDFLKKSFNLPALPITPFFPWLPFPFNFGSLPVKWQISIGKSIVAKEEKNRDKLENAAKQASRFTEGVIQAEINRLLRLR